MVLHAQVCGRVGRRPINLHKTPVVTIGWGFVSMETARGRKSYWGKSMDLKKMIAELEAERDRLDHAILALERLARGPHSKRGRPPKWLRELGPADSDPNPSGDVAKSHANGKK